MCHRPGCQNFYENRKNKRGGALRFRLFENLFRQYKYYRNNHTLKLKMAQNAYFTIIFWSPTEERSDVIWRKFNSLLKPNTQDTLDNFEQEGEWISGTFLADVLNIYYSTGFSMTNSDQKLHWIHERIQQSNITILWSHQLCRCIRTVCSLRTLTTEINRAANMRNTIFTGKSCT